MRVKKKDIQDVVCDPGESEGRVAPGWAPRERVRSKRPENQVGRPEIEQTGATRGRPYACRGGSTVPVGWRELGVVFFLARVHMPVATQSLHSGLR